jgi:RNA polymerase II subunit A-like phosphatase
LFDVRVFTWGLRHYAQEVVKLLDPEDKTIHSKIVTRDDCTNTLTSSKEIQQKDLNRIFPCSQSMVLVIDDDPRVWASAQRNLITIPKCMYNNQFQCS